jgi:hypothetical protein
VVVELITIDVAQVSRFVYTQDDSLEEGVEAPE